MAETSDFTTFVEVIEGNFHSSHHGHFLEIVEKFFSVGFSFSWELSAFEVVSINFVLNWAKKRRKFGCTSLILIAPEELANPLVA